MYQVIVNTRMIANSFPHEQSLIREASAIYAKDMRGSIGLEP